MKDSYQLLLNVSQIEILIETAESFINNQKMLHVPDDSGEVVALPLTLEALRQMKRSIEQNEVTDQARINVHLDRTQKNLTKMTIELLGESYVYELNEEEFDTL